MHELCHTRGFQPLNPADQRVIKSMNLVVADGQGDAYKSDHA
ncbi:hypothetical protein EDO6_03247 [Paenibacillus xylanexedens]|nr:hypothetical protein EDO6_03247 [Paenibacillus xylanexedens]